MKEQQEHCFVLMSCCSSFHRRNNVLLLLISFFSFSVASPTGYISTEPAAPPISNDNTTTKGFPFGDVQVSSGRSWNTSNITVANTTEGWALLPVLLQPYNGPTYACGLLCLTSNDNAGNATTSPCQGSILFGVFIVIADSSDVSTDMGQPIVVWSANRNKPVGHFAILNFSDSGDIRLEDGQGGTVWSSGVATEFAGMNLTREGNLVLYDQNSNIIWKSFDYPTDTVLLGQSLTGMQLVSNTSTEEKSDVLFSLSVTETSYSAFVQVHSASPPQIYYSSDSKITGGTILPRLVSDGMANRFVRLEVNGHLVVYKWSTEDSVWKPFTELIAKDYRGDCLFPMTCNLYGYCNGGECSCPRTKNNESYFEPYDFSKPKSGCIERYPFSCEPEQQHLHQLIDYGQIAFYGYAGKGDILGIDLDTCKKACANNCSCLGVFFKYGINISNGDCYLPTTILSLTANNWTQSNYNSSVFLKVAFGSTHSRWRLWLAIAIVVCLLIAGSCMILIFQRRRRYIRRHRLREETEGEEDDVFEFTHLPGMPTHFSYEELRLATNNFSRKLGEGGFGAVFHGTLRDGMEIAVKILGYRGQGMKEFLAEVETIGSIHHVNLVTLVGYCADRIHRLLVYEFLGNGSLEKWIFHRAEHSLDWPTKYKIVLDVAKGLSYLHEECRKRIIHLDIKPQNILLDEKFNAKVSDFGLSKLMDKDQSEVVTALRGTPGYIAPEWLSYVITEKVDVYSFGVVVLEMVSGKRVLDNSRSQGSLSLLSLLKRAVEENRLVDIVGEECRGEEAMRMTRLAMWCLQGDYNKRPSMSVVVKVLEKVMDVESDLEMNFWIPSSSVTLRDQEASSSLPSDAMPMVPSVRSGPR